MVSCCSIRNTSFLDALEEQLRRAHALTPDLISNVIADACTRLPVMKRAGKAAQIDQLIEAGAWDNAALALIELELPAWKLRRLVDEDGEWLCSPRGSRICLWPSMTLQMLVTRCCLWRF
jgi:hypothetical protein